MLFDFRLFDDNINSS